MIVFDTCLVISAFGLCLWYFQANCLASKRVIQLQACNSFNRYLNMNGYRNCFSKITLGIHSKNKKAIQSAGALATQNICTIDLFCKKTYRVSTSTAGFKDASLCTLLKFFSRTHGFRGHAVASTGESLMFNLTCFARETSLV